MRINTRTSPTKRSLALLASNGWLADIAEHRQGPITRDLFGVIDIVAVHPQNQQVLFVQCTSNNGGHVAARRAKLKSSPATKALLQAGTRVEVWGWSHERAEPRIVALRLSGPKEPTPPRETT
jgi:hypothetical protein